MLVQKQAKGKGVIVDIKTPENITLVTETQYANAAITVSPHNTQNIYLPSSSKEITIPKNSYFLVQKKTYNKYPESEKKNFSILWELDTAYFLIKKGV